MVRCTSWGQQIHISYFLAPLLSNLCLLADELTPLLFGIIIEIYVLAPIILMVLEVGVPPPHSLLLKFYYSVLYSSLRSCRWILFSLNIFKYHLHSLLSGYEFIQSIFIMKSFFQL